MLARIRHKMIELVALCNSVGIAEFNEQYVAMVVSTPSLALEIY